jgi:cell division protein FtsN
MTNKGLVALGVGAVSLILLLVLYFFWPAARPPLSPEGPEKPEIKSQALPEEKPGPGAPPAPTPPEKAQPAGPPEQPAAKPGLGLTAPPESALAPLEPVEKYGLKAGSYRKYRDAGKKLHGLKKQGQPAFIRKEKGKYQVWVGPFETGPEAEAAAKSLRPKFKISAKVQKVVMPVPK